MNAKFYRMSATLVQIILIAFVMGHLAVANVQSPPTNETTNESAATPMTIPVAEPGPNTLAAEYKTTPALVVLVLLGLLASGAAVSLLIWRRRTVAMNYEQLLRALLKLSEKKEQRK